jgi:hypothetical protein
MFRASSPRMACCAGDPIGKGLTEAAAKQLGLAVSRIHVSSAAELLFLFCRPAPLWLLASLMRIAAALEWSVELLLLVSRC